MQQKYNQDMSANKMDKMRHFRNTQINEWDSKNRTGCLMLLYIQEHCEQSEI